MTCVPWYGFQVRRLEAVATAQVINAGRAVERWPKFRRWTCITPCRLSGVIEAGVFWRRVEDGLVRLGEGRWAL